MEAKNTLNKIAVLLGLKQLEENEAHTVYMTEEYLEDGTLIATDAEEWAKGVEVFIVPDEGDKMPLPVGEYSLQGGAVLVVVDEGIVAEFLPAEEIKDEEEVTEEVSAKEEMADVEDWEGMERRIQNLEDAVAKLKEDKIGGDDDVEEMEGEEPSTNPKTIKTTEVKEFEVLDAIRDFVETLSKEHKEIIGAKDSVIDVMTENLATAQNEAEEAEAKLISFAAAPATEAIKHTPNPSAHNEEKVDLGKMSTQERVTHIMKNNK